ncbi:DUF3822 family protein [Phaeocystidibacter luteus]|uniref:DUF3822 family protein n=1 Tax=Phaeocystidibacter luteus TaxID=911197 RepID=A0A6N6RKN2_9FLAO|nr:DUF3822 family protein [Phaeocystidibacter luteus]KAB2808050.1 DUF3822 family protein [Phaeocystidibacter luteus]
MVTGSKSISTRAEFIDDAIEQLSAVEGVLSIFHTEGGLSFSLAHASSGRVMLLVDYELDNRPESGLELLNQFNETFKSYQLGWDVERFTWIPQELFLESETTQLGSKLLGINNAIATPVPELEAVLIHSPIPPVLERIAEALEAPILLPKPASDALSLGRHWKTRPGEHVYLHLEKEYVDILAFSNGKLQLHNRFVAKTKEDKLYFVLYAYEQLKFHPDEVPLKLTGGILENDDLWKSFDKYVRNVEWLENLNQIHSTAAIPQSQLRQYAPLIHLHSCV